MFILFQYKCQLRPFQFCISMLQCKSSNCYVKLNTGLKWVQLSPVIQEQYYISVGL